MCVKIKIYWLIITIHNLMLSGLHLGFSSSGGQTQLPSQGGQEL